MYVPVILGLMPLTAACVTAATAAPEPVVADTCQAAPGQSYLGRTASSASAAELLRVTGSRELRWVAPGMMVTMDYKAGRLTVGYDDAMRITTVSCG